MRRVILESPFAGDIEAHVAYARRCLRDCLARGEAPIASHLLYPQILDDSIAAERALGIAAGLGWLRLAEAMVAYIEAQDWASVDSDTRAIALFEIDRAIVALRERTDQGRADRAR